MLDSQLDQSPPPHHEELGQSDSLEEVMRLAVEAAQLHMAREQARLATQTTAEERRSETALQAPSETDVIALLKRELDQTKDLGMRYAATAIRLSNEVDALKSALKLSQAQILDTRRHGDMADAQRQESPRQMLTLQTELTCLRDELAAQHAQLAALRQEAQADLTRANEQLAQNCAEISALRDQLNTSRQDSAAQAERLQTDLWEVEDASYRDKQAGIDLLEELERARQESASLRDERRRLELDLERAHAALQEKDRALNEALLLVTFTETAAQAFELELLRMHDLSMSGSHPAARKGFATR